MTLLMPPKKLDSLQCARACAAVLVVYFHTSLQVAKIWKDNTDIFVQTGQCGVDVFFIISGFIIWNSTRDSTISLGTFYRRRIARICPLYWVLTIAAAAISVAIPWVLKSTRFELSHFLASLAFIPWPNPAWTGGGDFIRPVIVPGWTLNFEMMFYFLLGLSMIGHKINRLLQLLIILFIFACFVVIFGAYSPMIAFYDPFLMLEFFSGVLIATASDKLRLIPPWLAWSLLLASGLAMVVLDSRYLSISRFFSSGLPAAVIIISLLSIEMRGKWPSVRTLVSLGDASYSLYLTHVFVLAGMRVFWTNVIRSRSDIVGQICFMFISIILACLLATLSYHYLERPLGRMADRVFIYVGRFAHSIRFSPAVTMSDD